LDRRSYSIIISQGGSSPAYLSGFPTTGLSWPVMDEGDALLFPKVQIFARVTHVGRQADREFPERGLLSGLIGLFNHVGLGIIQTHLSFLNLSISTGSPGWKCFFDLAGISICRRSFEYFETFEITG